MDLVSYLEILGTTFGLSTASATALTKLLVNHELKKDLAKQKAGLQAELDKQKTLLEGATRQQVETILADQGADREYNLEARKRLYSAIGPLRFQLLMACRDLSGRVLAHVREPYSTSVTTYYGRTTLFRILRPITIVELIERQIGYADFSVDSGAADLLRFKKNSLAIFAGESLVKGHSAINWNDQIQHVFYENINKAAAALIISDKNGAERCVRFDEFEQLIATGVKAFAFDPFVRIMENFTPKTKPLFWVRLVAYGFLCNEFINRAGNKIGFEIRDYPLGELLLISEDAEIKANITEYVTRCRSQLDRPL